MKKLFIFLFIFWSTICLAAPSITSISGTYTNGQTITIGGSGFGTKSQAAPQISSYDHPTSAYNWGSGGSYDAAWTYNGSQTAISTAVKRSTLPQSTYSSRATMNGGYNNIGYNSGSAWVDSYVSYWLYQDYTDYHLADGENGFKYFRWYVDSGGVGDLILCWIGTGSTPSNMQINTEALASTCAYVLDYNPYSWAKYSTTYLHLRQNGHIPSTQAWHHYEIYFHIPTDPNTCTNSGYMMIDGETSVRWHDIRMSSSTNNNNRILRLGHVSGAMSATQYDYIDQVYVDNTLARVILSSSSTMTSWPDIASERHTEIQVPTSWADGSIQVTLNRGSFADSSTVYVYVVDSTGAVNSTGYTVTLGGSAGATYYIDPAAANDTDTGLSDTHPWKTLGAHTGTLATSNDVYFKAGSTITENQVTWPMSGTSGDRCIIGSYGTGAKPIWVVPNNQESGLMLEQKSYVTIQDIEFNGGKATTPGNFIRVHIPNELIIQRCTFESDDVYNAVYLWNNTASSTSANILIDLCTFTSTQVSPNQNYGIRVSIYSPGETINNVTVQNCTFDRWRYAVYFVDTNYTDYVFLNNKEPYGLIVQDNVITNCTQAIGYTLGTVDQTNHPSYIRRNTITDTGSMTVGTDPEYSGYTNALQIQHCDGLVIEYNTIHGVLSGEAGGLTDGHGICIDFGAASNLYPSQNCVIRNNDISDCLHAGINAFKSTSCQYYNNYIHDCTNYGVLVDSAINTGNLWYNNTIVNNAVHGFRIGSSTELVPAQTLRNNIITGSVIGLRVRSDETFPNEDYNSFYNNTYNYRDSDNVDHSLNTHDITGNPLLTGYVLGATSPCINTGTTLAAVTADIRGVSRPQGSEYDIGAYEFVGVTMQGCSLSGGAIH